MMSCFVRSLRRRRPSTRGGFGMDEREAAVSIDSARSLAAGFSLGADALQPLASHFAQNAHFAALFSRDKDIDGKEVLLKGGQVGSDHLYSLALEGFAQA